MSVIVILTVGAVWNSPYEVYANSAVARKVRVPEGAIQALASGESPEGLTSNELIAHRFTRQLTAERRVDDDLYRKGKEAFGEGRAVGHDLSDRHLASLALS